MGTTIQRQAQRQGLQHQSPPIQQGREAEAVRCNSFHANRVSGRPDLQLHLEAPPIRRQTWPEVQPSPFAARPQHTHHVCAVHPYWYAMNHVALYADPYYPSFLGALRGALHAWGDGDDPASIDAWTASCCLETAMDLLTVGLLDETVETARAAWEAIAIGNDNERNTVLEKLKALEAGMRQPDGVTSGDEKFCLWRTEFLAGVRAASTAINDSGADYRSGPVYVPDDQLDSWVAAVMYLSAWTAPGHQVGSEYAHWAAFYGSGQPPPRTGRKGDERGVARFPWGHWEK